MSGSSISSLQLFMGQQCPSAEHRFSRDTCLLVYFCHFSRVNALHTQHLLSIIMYYGVGTQCRSLFSSSTQSRFSEPLRSEPLISVRARDNMTNKLKWIILFGDWMNIGGHLPCAVKEALAGATAFSRTAWIKPKSRGTIPIHLALPSIITAKKHDTS